MDDIRTDREVGHHELTISDPRPLNSVNNAWASAAIVGIFLLLFGAFLYVGRPILMPILAAAVLALTLAPVIKGAKRFGIPTWVTAIVILLLGLGFVSIAAMALARPVSEWIGRAPEIGASIRDKLAVLDEPMAATGNVAIRRQRRGQCEHAGVNRGASSGRVRHPGRRRTGRVLHHFVVFPYR